MPYVNNREAELEKQGIVEGPNTPQPTALPQPLPPEDQAFVIGYGPDRARLQAEAPEAAGRIQANEIQVARHFLESVDPHLRRLGYFEKYAWNDEGHLRAIAKLKEIFVAKPDQRAALLDSSGRDYDYAKLAAFVMSEVAPAVAKDVSFSPLDSDNADYIRERQEWISKRRGYGFQGNEYSSSQNLGTHH
jgi:hypothetical protein